MLKKLLFGLIGLGGITGVTLFGFTIFDYSDRQAEREKEAETSGALLIKKWASPIPSCAVGRKQTINGKPSFKATLFERWNGSEPMIDSARRNAIAASPVSVPGGEPVSYALVLFHNDGYQVTFDFAERIPPKKELQAAGRECPGSLRTRPQHQNFSTCEELAAALQAKIDLVTSVDTPKIFWYKYEYTENFERLELDFLSTFCLADGAS